MPLSSPSVRQTDERRASVRIDSVAFSTNVLALGLLTLHTTLEKPLGEEPHR